MTFLNRDEVLMSLRSLLQLMHFQVKRPVSEIDIEFFFRISESFYKKLDLYYYETNILSCQDHATLTRLHDEVKDLLDVATREKYPNRAPCFFSRAFRKAEKSADGWPLEPVQLCDLLDEDIFKDLPAVGESGPESEQIQAAVQVNASTSKGLSNCAGSIELVISLVGLELIKRGFFTVESWISYQEQKYYLKMRPF